MRAIFLRYRSTVPAASEHSIQYASSETSMPPCPQGNLLVIPEIVLRQAKRQSRAVLLPSQLICNSPDFHFPRVVGGILLSPTKVQNLYHITNQLVIKFLNIWRHSLNNSQNVWLVHEKCLPLLPKTYCLTLKLNAYEKSEC